MRGKVSAGIVSMGIIEGEGGAKRCQGDLKHFLGDRTEAVYKATIPRGFARLDRTHILCATYSTANYRFIRNCCTRDDSEMYVTGLNE